MKRLSYPSHLAEKEWVILELLISPVKPGGHPRTTDMREVINALLYLDRTGCQWRALPHEFLPWSTVWSYCRAFRNDGIWERMHTALREQVRVKQGREPTPSAAIIDSQSTANRSKPRREADPTAMMGEKLSGRKKHLLVDTMGLLLKVVVHAADIQDLKGVKLLLEPITGRFPRISLVWVDNGYTGTGRTWIKKQMGT